MTAHVPVELRRQVAEDAGHRCGYCLSDELLTGVPLAVDHIVPAAKAGETVRDNLWLACRPCNEFKGVETHAPDPETGQLAALFNPRQQSWAEHFAWSKDSILVVGITPTGRATVAALHLNRPLLVKARRRWVAAGWHPPAGV
jgi:hypothetical protein